MCGAYPAASFVGVAKVAESLMDCRVPLKVCGVWSGGCLWECSEGQVILWGHARAHAVEHAGEYSGSTGGVLGEYWRSTGWSTVDRKSTRLNSSHLE